MFCPSHLPNSNPSFSPSPSSSPLIVCLPESSSSTISISNNNQLECQKRMKELENQIAAQKAQTEAILAKRKEEKEKGKAEMQRQTTERQLKEENEKQQQLLQKQETERKMKAAEAEKQHQQKLKEIEERRLKDIQVMEAEMKLIERKKEARLKSVQNEYQKEIENRQRQEENQIQTLKIINEEDEQKLRALTKTLGELKTVVAEKAQEMKGIKLIPEDPKPNVYHPIIHVEDNKLIGSSSIIINEGPSNIGVIGLPKSGRSFLIGALAGGIWPKDLPTANPARLKSVQNEYQKESENRQRQEENQIETLKSINEEDEQKLTALTKTLGELKTVVAEKAQEMKDLNMPFSKNHIFNISALAMIQISEEGVTSNMTIYKQDELALLAHLNEHGFGDQRKPDLINADIVILGIKGAGKSTIAESLRHCLNLSKREKFIYEIEYSEMMDVDEILAKIDISKSPIYLFVIPNTVGKMDAELSKYLINFNKNVCVVLNKSDEMIDNLKKQQNFYGNDDYVQKRHEAAQTEFVKVGINPKNFPCFS
uniref:Uncharacterized protein n=1 Tax=Panagrolaimus sp. ES5 TaxID=591445 RepID=A0AC34FYK1_9BILA